MGMPKRFCVSILAFFGLLLVIGYRGVFAMVMVYVLRESDNAPGSLFKQCTLNGTVYDLRMNWDVAVSQYFNTAFFTGYVITQLPGGYMAARFSSKWVFGMAVMLSSILQIILSFLIKYGIAVVFVVRTIQGLAEGLCIPSLNGVISAWAPKSERTRMVTIIFAGAYLSPAVAMFISGASTCYISWHSSLFLYGGLGIMWSVAWLIFVYDTPDQHPSLTAQERSLFEQEGPKVQASSHTMAKSIPWTSILRSLPVSAIFVGNFCRNWIFSMVITELPQYFADGYDMNIASIGFLTAFPEVLMTIVVVAGGVLFDILIKKELVSVTLGRKIAQSAGFGLEGVCIFILVFVDDYKVAVVLLCMGVGVSGLAISGYQVNPLDLAPQYAHVLTGISRLSCIGAIFSTAVAGYMREDNIRSWQKIFLIASVIHLSGVVYYCIFASGRRQPWAEDGVTITISDDKLSLVKAKMSTYGTSDNTNFTD